MTVFNAEERQTIDDVLDQFDGLTAGQVSDLSHEEPGWQLTELGETIPYPTATLGYPQVSTPTTRRLSLEAAAK